MFDSLQLHGLYNLPGSSVHGIFQARILEWVAISFSRESSQLQGSNPGLPHCRQMLLPSEPPGKPAKVMGGNLKAKAVIFHLWMIFPGGCEGSTWERTPSPANTRSCHWETGVQKGPRGTLSAARAKRLLGYLDIYPRSYHHVQGRNHFPGPLGCINA